MYKNKHFQNILELNFAVMFMSTSGVLGKYIDVPVPVVISSRAILAGILIYLFCKWRQYNLKIKRQDRWVILGSGLLMGLHWVTYFYSLKLSNVAIGMLSIYTFPVITVFLEPIILKTKFRFIHLVLGILVIVGIYFLVPDFNIQNDYFKAVLLGVLSAFLMSLRNIISKSKIQEYNGSVLMFHQLIVVSIMLSPSFILADTSGMKAQFPEILLLAILTTAIGHTWFLHSFKKFSATSASIISSIQPVYGILIGMFFVKEFPEPSTIIGGVLIIMSVMMESILSFRKNTS